MDQDNSCGMRSQIIYSSSSIRGLEALSCDSSFHFADHIHTGHVLWCSAGGGERYRIKKKNEILQQGSICIIEPGVVHSNGPFSKGSRHLCSLYLEEDFLHHLDTLLTGYGGRQPCLPTAVIAHKQYWQYTIALHEAIITGAEQLRVEELLIPLFASLAKAAGANTLDIAGTGNARQTMERVVEYMYSMLQENLSLGMLAEIAGCSSFHFMRVFKLHYGMSPHAYLVQLRLERARTLLHRGESIANAAHYTGFADQSHLTRRFKQRYGLTPGLYRQQKIF